MWARSERHDDRRAVLLVAAFAVLWVILEQVVGARLQGQYPLLQVVWCRYAAHLVALGLIWSWRREGSLWRTGRPVFHLARSLLMLVMPWSFVMALQSGTSPDLTWAIFWIAPVVVVAGGYALGERATRTQWALAGVGAVVAAGMLVPAGAGVPNPIYPLLMALSFGLYVVMTRALRTEPVMTNLFYTAAGVFVALTPVMLRTWVMPTPGDAVVLAAIGVVGLAALWVLDRSTVYAPVAGPAPVLYLHVVAAAGLAMARGHEPNGRVIAGTLMLTAIGMRTWAVGRPWGAGGDWDRASNPTGVS